MSSLENTTPFQLKLSAPGKIILFGEYSVVFHKPAVAATLCLRTKLNFAETSESFVHLKFTALDLDKKFDLKDIKCMKVEENSDWNDYLAAVVNSTAKLYEKTYNVFDLSDAQRNSLVAFFHCFRKCFGLSSGFKVIIDSDLTLGSGIGSSASFSVVLSAAALLYEYKLNGREKGITESIERNEDGYSIVDENLKNFISQMAYSCEKIFHGSPSGVDNNTVLLGSMVEFMKSNDGINKIRSIATLPIKVLLVNTNVPRSTKILVEHVKRILKSHSKIIENVLNSMEAIAKSAVEILTNNNETGNILNHEEYLSELITFNHGLLRVLGVSHPSLENIVSVANKYNLSAKLTGAGGGGFAFIYLPSHIELSVITAVTQELKLFGYTVFEVILGGPGLIIEKLYE